MLTWQSVTLDILRQMASTPDRLEALSELVDLAEAGKLKDPLPIYYVGMSGEKTA